MRTADRIFALMVAVDSRTDDTALVALRMVDGASPDFARALRGALDCVDAAARRDYVAFWVASTPCSKSLDVPGVRPHTPGSNPGDRMTNRQIVLSKHPKAFCRQVAPGHFEVCLSTGGSPSSAWARCSTGGSPSSAWARAAREAA